VLEPVHSESTQGHSRASRACVAYSGPEGAGGIARLSKRHGGPVCGPDRVGADLSFNRDCSSRQVRVNFRSECHRREIVHRLSIAVLSFDPGSSHRAGRSRRVASSEELGQEPFLDFGRGAIGVSSPRHATPLSETLSDDGAGSRSGDEVLEIGEEPLVDALKPAWSDARRNL
jgi:hypothetical protein